MSSYQPIITSSDFTAFFKYKTFDVLTNGKYKRFLTFSKEKGDSWAVDLYNRQNKVQQCIKQVHMKIHLISKTAVGIACKNVTNCAQPPVKISMGFSTCCITGFTSDKCLDLSKSGKKNQEIHIHPTFAYFFLFLWYICKLEYVIRACSKNWSDIQPQGGDNDGKVSTGNQGKRKKTANSPSEEELDNKTEEEEQEYRIPHKELDGFMKDNQDLCNSLFSVFEKALDYVHQSLDLYIKDITVQPILQPGEDFWLRASEQGNEQTPSSHKKHKKNPEKKWLDFR